MAKFAASTNAPARDGLPFLVLPWPLRLPFLNFRLPTHRQYEAKSLPVAKRLISPLSPRQALYPVATNGEARVLREQILDTHESAGPLAHPLTTLAQQSLAPADLFVKTGHIIVILSLIHISSPRDS